jgi:hypothetical protein
MADDPKTTADQVRAIVDARRLMNGKAPTPMITNAPGPGFRFATGDAVIDLVTGTRGVVAAWYQSATNQGPTYEVRTGPGAVIVRLEKELERDGPRNVPNFLPRI